MGDRPAAAAAGLLYEGRSTSDAQEKAAAGELSSARPEDSTKMRKGARIFFRHVCKSSLRATSVLQSATSVLQSSLRATSWTKKYQSSLPAPEGEKKTI
jgi:hypothetical protein